VVIVGQVREHVASGLEEKLKAARLDLLALFGAIDRLKIDARELHWPTLEGLFELDGDYAQALSALDEQAARIDIGRMLRDTRRSLGSLAGTRARFLGKLPAARRGQLEAEALAVRPTLSAQDAWHSVPGKGPMAGNPFDADD